MKITKVGVVGCGLMGSGIAQTCAQAGYQVLVGELAQDYLEKGLQRIHGAWDMMVAKGKMSANEANLSRAYIRGTLDMDEFRDCDLVIEAIIENIEEKTKLFRVLDRALRPEAIIASNTSSLPIAQVAAVTNRQDRVAGLHFFNPAPVMKLVEVVKAIGTSDETVHTLYEFAGSLGKTPVLAKDTAGFVVNALLVPYLMSAIRMYENGVASKEDIDTAMKLGCGYPMGPFVLLDYIGLDTALYAAQAMYDEFREPLYAPPPMLKRMVLSGRLGTKNGKGFYEYGEK